MWDLRDFGGSACRVRDADPCGCICGVSELNQWLASFWLYAGTSCGLGDHQFPIEELQPSSMGSTQSMALEGPVSMLRQLQGRVKQYLEVVNRRSTETWKRTI